jgi:exosome complex RNA-binding protein Rrp4
MLQANAGNDIAIAKNGYLYVYVSNESMGRVYFCKIRVEHDAGAMGEGRMISRSGWFELLLVERRQLG